MSRAQLLWRQASPSLDIDTLAALDTEETLRVARHCADTLVHGVDETDAWYKGFVRTRYAVNGGSVLRFTKIVLKTTVAVRADSAWALTRYGFWRDHMHFRTRRRHIGGMLNR